MKFSAKEFGPAEHNLLAKWLMGRGKDVPSLDFLPPTGVVVSYYEQPVCMGFMIKCDNGMAINTDFISDPEVPKDLRNAAVEHMRQCLYKEALKAGLKMVTVFTSIPKHADNLKAKGFVELDSKLTQLGRILWR